ncbi:MAG TPA: hypothetical protein VFT57_11985 [Gemmatimonadaceae bacterium]|jgi:hypothetical protein|nr:hypothetical protein [Gemmatimonadaceae bacterium]
METGREFLRGQVDDAVVLHRAFVDALRDHGDDADDPRFSELCARFMPIMEEHQRQLEAFQRTLGAEGGIRKKVLGRVVGAARELADVAREDDYRRLIGDIALSSMAENAFRTFREAGRILRDQRLAELGALGERQHDDFNRDANRLAQAMFVEHVRAGEESDQSGVRSRTGVSSSRAKRR